MKRLALATLILWVALPARAPAQKPKATYPTVLTTLIEQVKAQQAALDELNSTQVKLQEQMDKLEQRITSLEQSQGATNGK